MRSELCTLRTDQRPTTDFSILKISNDTISRKGSSDPLHVWFYGGVFGVGGWNGAISSWLDQIQ